MKTVISIIVGFIIGIVLEKICFRLYQNFGQKRYIKSYIKYRKELDNDIVNLSRLQ